MYYIVATIGTTKQSVLNILKGVLVSGLTISTPAYPLVNNGAQYVQIDADIANTGDVYVGGSEVSGTAQIGQKLDAGQKFEREAAVGFNPIGLESIYIVGSAAGQVVRISVDKL